MMVPCFASDNSHLKSAWFVLVTADDIIPDLSDPVVEFTPDRRRVPGRRGPCISRLLDSATNNNNTV